MLNCQSWVWRGGQNYREPLVLCHLSTEVKRDLWRMCTSDLCYCTEALYASVFTSISSLWHIRPRNFWMQLTHLDLSHSHSVKHTRMHTGGTQTHTHLWCLFIDDESLTSTSLTVCFGNSWTVGLLSLHFSSDDRRPKGVTVWLFGDTSVCVWEFVLAGQRNRGALSSRGDKKGTEELWWNREREWTNAIVSTSRAEARQPNAYVAEIKNSCLWIIDDWVCAECKRFWAVAGAPDSWGLEITFFSLCIFNFLEYVSCEIIPFVRESFRNLIYWLVELNTHQPLSGDSALLYHKEC